MIKENGQVTADEAKTLILGKLKSMMHSCTQTSFLEKHGLISGNIKFVIIDI